MTTRSGHLRGFTLLEMIVVLALIAVLAAATLVSLGRRSGLADESAQAMADYDRLAREWSRRFGRPNRVVFDLDRGRVRRAAAGLDGEGDARPPAALRLPDGSRIARLMLAGRSHDAGEVAIGVSPRGQTRSYAVLLEGRGGERRWLVVAGLTGRPTAVDDAHEVEAIFSSPPGSDDAP
jgi:prepilin-type N-terminal cleavage/methylation domain-containing protein